MSKKQTISVPLIADPRGVNVPIQEMQEALSALTWLQFSYGQAFRNVTEVDGSRYVMPQVYAGNREFLSVEPDDSTSAFSFFEITEQGSKTYEFASEWIQRVSLVVYCNLEIINQIESKDRDYIFTEELREEVNTIIREGNLSFIDGETFTIERGIENAFSNYSYWTFDERYIKRNYDAFKISFDIRFDDRCQLGKLDADYQAVLDKANSEGYTLPSISIQQKQSNVIVALKAANQWSKLKSFALFLDTNEEFSLIDWKDPNNIYTALNSPVYSAMTGFQMNGIDTYLDTNYVPDEFVLDANGSFGFFYEDAKVLTPVVSYSFFGTEDTFTEYQLRYNGSTSRAIAELQGNTQWGQLLSLYLFAPGDEYYGMWFMKRIGSNIDISHSNSAVTRSRNEPSSGVTNSKSIVIGANNTMLGVSDYAEVKVKSWYYGDDLDYTAMKSIITSY